MKLKNPAIYYTGVVAYPDGTQALLDFHKSEAGARKSALKALKRLKSAGIAVEGVNVGCVAISKVELVGQPLNCETKGN